MSSASSATLTTLRDRVELLLQDSSNAIYATGDIDEAIRQAVDRYQEVSPRTAVATVELSSAGREIDISGLTGYLEVRRVWWDYDASAPGYPPRWRGFEVWPGDILFITDADEPAGGDTVRIWYTLRHTLDGLDGATATTFRADHESALAAGAAGLAAVLRSHEVAETVNADGQAPVHLRDWGAAMLDRFEAELARIARRRAAVDSGVSSGPPLDRWDSGR